MYTEKEKLSRRQFHELFCTRFLYTGSKKDALNDDSWDAEVLYEILHALHPENILTKRDIESIVMVSGMRDSKNGLFFHYHEDTPIMQNILDAMSPHIAIKSYILCKQKLNGRADDSLTNFLKARYDSNMTPVKIAASTLYNMYIGWCIDNVYSYINKHAFYNRLATLGYYREKGYLNGVCGVSYFTIRIRMQEGLCNETEKDQGEESFQPLRNDTGTGTEIPTEVIQETENGISADEEDSVYATNSEDDGTEYAEDDPVIESDNVRESTYSNTDEPADDFNRTPEKVNIPGTGKTEKQLIIERVKQLPPELSSCFKMMKISYRIAPDHFTFDDFKQSIPCTDPSQVDILYDLFLRYADKTEEKQNE